MTKSLFKVVTTGNSVDWSVSAKPDVHLFIPSTSGEEACQLGQDCQNT